MNNDENKKEGVPAHTDGSYQAIASQEEIHLEEVEESLRAILTSYQPFPSHSGGA